MRHGRSASQIGGGIIQVNRLKFLVMAVGLVGALLLAKAAVYGVVPPAVTLPELPRQYVSTDLGKPSGRMIRVPPGGDFQAALNAARLGDVIILQAGATYVGPFVLPKKEGADWLVV